MKKIEITLRDITIDQDVRRMLPCDDLNLNKNHEYIIVDHDGTLPLEELTSVTELNDFLKENQWDKTILKALNKAGYLLNEIIEGITEDAFIIIDFDAETEGWNSGMGGDIHSGEDKALCLYKQGLLSFPFKVTEEMEPYINWEARWIDLECSGWRECTVNENSYLIERIY